MFPRLLKQALLNDAFCGKALIVVGARQVGKTTLVKEVAETLAKRRNTNICFIDGEDPDERERINNKGKKHLQKVIGAARILVIDEGQKVPTIGQTVKLLVDTYKKDLQIFVTGSSTFHLLDSTQEPLTGRKFVHNLYPLSLEERFGRESYRAQQELAEILMYGSYPEIVSNKSFEQKKQTLKEHASSTLYQDIVELSDVRNPDVVPPLLKALALQIGSLVSHTELSSLLGVEKSTITRYINLLRKNFIIFTLPPYTTKKRKELSKMHKVYFYDVGIRNAVLENFSPLENRNDVGALFENFVIAERMKWREYHGKSAYQYFWRTYDGAEVDLVEEHSGELHGYECAWGRKKSAPEKWLKYPKSSYTVINRENVADFLFS